MSYVISVVLGTFNRANETDLQFLTQSMIQLKYTFTPQGISMPYYMREGERGRGGEGEGVGEGGF